MSIDSARAYLKAWGKDKAIIELNVSTATVSLAAMALNVDEARIAKTLSLVAKDMVVLIVTAGDAKIDNKKYKEEFGCKAKMIDSSLVGNLVGHEVGGVCPFGINEGVNVFLDISLKRFTTVFPACGSSDSAIELTCAELEAISKASRWIDVCSLH